MTELSYPPRETAPQGTRVTSWWIDGSRDRYGEALFVSNATALLRDGSERQSWIVWQNRRPYAPNVKVCELAERPETWAQLDAALSGIEARALWHLANSAQPSPIACDGASIPGRGAGAVAPREQQRRRVGGCARRARQSTVGAGRIPGDVEARRSRSTSMSVQEWEARYPTVEWRKPQRATLMDTSGWVCRICVAEHGLKGDEVDRVFATEQACRKHIERAHTP